MRKYLLSVLLLCLSVGFVQAQDETDSNQAFNVDANIQNPSTLINDGSIDLQVTGGKAPYTYKWTDQETSLKSNKATGLVEGIPYEVVVTDASGESVTQSYRIEAESITEHFNGFFKPLVNNMGSILFWGPFSSLGLYDPVVYADVKRVATPSWSVQTDEVYTLKKWLKSENSEVKKRR